MITVAVASYNHAPYIRECLTSIAAQTHSDIELVWVDDASTDDSYLEMRRTLDDPAVAGRFTHILTQRNSRNRGAAFSLNLAARMGTGRLISFLNSDDFYHSSRLSILQQYDQGEKFFFAFSNIMPIAADGEALVVDPTGGRIAFDADLLYRRYGSVSKALLSRQIASSTGNFVVSRTLFEAVGGFTDLKYCHDWMFALLACRFCEPVFVHERLYYYRIHDKNSFRSLGALAESETQQVLTRFFTAIAIDEPVNPECPSLRKEPASFWELVSVTPSRAYAERVFFPYTRNSRILSRNEETRHPKPATNSSRKIHRL